MYGLDTMMNVQKFSFSAKNHNVFQCFEEEVFESIYQNPQSFVTMCQSKRINFNDETRIDDEEMGFGGDLLFDNDDAPATVSNCV